jgi:acetyl esterase/lipase
LIREVATPVRIQERFMTLVDVRMPLVLAAVSVTLLTSQVSARAAEPITLNLWPSRPPGKSVELPPESDLSKPNEGLVAGKPLIRLGNVTTPQLVVYRPEPAVDTGSAVVICPGGGHHILAWDLEGTEVAEWLNTLGVTGIVLKYRVPARNPDKRWEAAVQDAQRAISVVRSRAAEWKLDPQRIGILGFSAGGETAARCAVHEERTYEKVDSADEQSTRPDFALLIYPAYLCEKGDDRLREDLPVTKSAPPAFLVHTFDDPVTPQSSLLLASRLKQLGVSAELHMYATGGHGYGLRKSEKPVSEWTLPAQAWLRGRGLLAKTER